MRALVCLLALGCPAWLGDATSTEEAVSASRPEWVQPPVVRVCPTLQATLPEVRSAVREWRRRCYRVGPVVRDECGSAEPGSIYLAGREPAEIGDSAGVTRVLHHGGALALAVVYVRTDLSGELVSLLSGEPGPGHPHTPRRMVLEHELGHALGIVDDPATPEDEAHGPPGSIMAPALDLAGSYDEPWDRCG